MIYDKNYYLDTFKVTQAQLEELTRTALAHGGSYSDLYFENSCSRELNLRDSKVSSGGFHVDYGVGIRVLCGEKTGYAYCENTRMDDMLGAAKAASAISQGVAAGCGTGVDATKGTSSQNQYTDRATRSFPGKPNPAADRYPILRQWYGCGAEELAAVLRKLEELVRAKDSRIVKVMAMISGSVSDILMYNSLGELKYETRPMGTIILSTIFSDGAGMQNNHVSRSYRAGAEMLTDALLEELATDATKGIDNLLQAKRPKGGKMSVVMGAGASGILLHEAMGHAFEADFNRKGQSIFSDKLGKRICREGINIVDDGTAKGGRGSLNFDDEGVPGQRTMMVEDGVLTSYLHDRISADFYDVKPTGNGRRESFRFNPIPRMRSTYMESGDSVPKDIIASVKEGIYVDEFANGQVKIGEGDFTFYVKSGFLIEGGHLTQPIKDINIMGNGPQALADIVAVGNDCKVDEGAWICGKEQSVPVSCGIPTVLVNNLIVGGE